MDDLDIVGFQGAAAFENIVALTESEAPYDPRGEDKRRYHAIHPEPLNTGKYQRVWLSDAAGGSAEQEIDFLARSVEVYNYSETWFVVDGASGLWIPPGLYNAQIPCYPGLARATLAVGVPPAVGNANTGKGEFCMVIFREDQGYRPGILLGTLV